MANFSYNDLPIQFIHTRNVQSANAYSEDNKDYCGTDHTITVSGVVYGQDQSDANANYIRIRDGFSAPRKRLLYTVAGQPVFDVNADRDLAGGPFPKVLSLDQVLGDNSFHITFSVTVRLWSACARKGPPDFLSNRWTETLTIGADHLSKITRTGTLRTRSNFLIDADDTARGIVTPPIEQNFNRVQSEYTMQSDGLALTYVISDVEVECNPPGPAVQILEADYMEHSADGQKRYGRATCSLRGRPRGDRKALLATGLLVCTRRLQAAGALRHDRKFQVTYSLREKLHKNEIHVSIETVIPVVSRATATPEELRKYRVEVARIMLEELGDLATREARIKELQAKMWPKAADFVGWGAKPAASTRRVPDPGLRGTGGLHLLAARLNDPCLKIAKY